VRPELIALGFARCVPGMVTPSTFMSKSPVRRTVPKPSRSPRTDKYYSSGLPVALASTCYMTLSMYGLPTTSDRHWIEQIDHVRLLLIDNFHFVLQPAVRIEECAQAILLLRPI